ncbi:MAG: hypothetical protein V5A46_00565 [Haloferacaceae archaeon]
MYPRRVLLLSVAVLVLLAGCAGGGGIASDPAGDGTAEGDDSGDGEGDAAVDAESFELSDPEAALRDAGSFTVAWTYAGVDAAGRESAVTREFYADVAAERSYTVTSSTTDGQPDGGTTEQFVAGGVTYFRSGTGDAATYTSYEGSTDVLGAAIALSQARAYGSNDDMTFVGTETFDGVGVDRYELPDAGRALILAGSTAASSPDDLRITDFEYVVLVDGNGLSRYESWSFSGVADDGTEVRGSWEYALTGVGSTAVDDPDWLEEARAQASE